MEETTKTCTKCEEPKSLNEFGKLTKGKDGKLPICKECNKARNSKYRNSKKGLLTYKTTKTNHIIEAFAKEVAGAVRKATHPETDVVLYFKSEVSRDECRTAMSKLNDVSRNHVSVQKV